MSLSGVLRFIFLLPIIIIFLLYLLDGLRDPFSGQGTLFFDSAWGFIFVPLVFISFVIFVILSIFDRLIVQRQLSENSDNPKLEGKKSDKIIYSVLGVLLLLTLAVIGRQLFIASEFNSYRDEYNTSR